MPVDPVCGMFVPDTSDLVSVIEGQKYFFCSPSCQNTFSAPEAQVAKLKRRLIIGWPLAIPVLIMTYWFFFPYKGYVLLILSIPVQFYSGLGFYEGAYHALKGRRGNMDLLIALGTSAAFFFSTFVVFFPKVFGSASGVYFDTSTFIVVLILTGNFIESVMKDRANKAAGKLIALVPNVTHLVAQDGTVKDVRTSEIKAENVVLVKPGEVFSVDGVVTEGRSDVDESMLTGEQDPVLKEVGKRVSSGTANLNGTLKIRVTRTGKDSTINQIYDSIQKAVSGRVKVQRIADVFSSIFVPVVLVAGIAAALSWYLFLAGGLGFVGAFVIAVLVFVSVLVISCPCAIGLATPLSLLISSTVSSENGIIIKNASSLDKLAKANRVVFDKTGTITDSDPLISSFTALEGSLDSKILGYAAAIESSSNHPVARAIVNYAKSKSVDILQSSDIKEIPGHGITGAVNGDKVEISRAKVKGGSAVEIMINGKLCGRMLLTYSVREKSVAAIRALRALGIKTSIVTGDSSEEASRIAEQIGIDDVHAEVLPDDKSVIVKNYQEKGDHVIFVGDGINDTIALETADVGIAMGSGSDIAKESGDIILLNSDLSNVVFAKLIGKNTISKVKQNIGWAVGYNSALIPIAGGLLVPAFGLGIYSFLPILAAVAMGFSSISVVINSLLLRPKIKKSLASVKELAL